MTTNVAGFRRRLAIGVASLALICGAATVSLAQPSNTNHGSETGQGNASQTGLNNSNVNGIGTAPVPEASTWAAMGGLVGVAAIIALVHRRRRLAA